MCNRPCLVRGEMAGDNGRPRLGELRFVDDTREKTR